MQSKKLGKHSLGFADAPKGKLKERGVLGSVKVGFHIRDLEACVYRLAVRLRYRVR